jgi:ethanolamine utilization protein EutP (predicted NTPase)
VELLYLWINQSENGIFQNQEVQLSDKFYISSCLEPDICTVTISKNQRYYNIYDNGVISNVSALVGSNGAGKTTLLNYIYGNDIMPKQKEDRPVYQEAIDNEYSKQKTIQVFEDVERLIIIHNLDQKVVTVVAPKNVEIIKMDNQTFTEMCGETPYLSSVTKIYLTNGNYSDNNGYGTESGQPNRIVLSLGSLRVFAHNFYNKTVNFPQGIINDTLYNG